jgi:FkbM family methyltransferase
MFLTGINRFKRALLAEFFDHPDPYGIRSAEHLDTIIDLGANCGLFSMMARFLHPKARIIAVEPNSDSYGALALNLRHLRVEFHHIGIGPRDAQPIYQKGKNQPGGQQYRSTPTSFSGESALGYTLATLWNEWRPQGRIFLKMDMEGAECHLHRNPQATQCLRECTYISAELHCGGRVENPDISMKGYRRWLRRSLGATHTFALETTRRGRYGDLRMVHRNA